MPAQVKLIAGNEYGTLSKSPLMITFSPTNPKDVGLHEIQLQISALYSNPKTYKFKLNILGNKKLNDIIKT